MKRNVRVEIYAGGEGGGKGKYHYRLVAGNGEIIIPPEGHGSRHDARRAWLTVKRLVRDSLIRVVEV